MRRLAFLALPVAFLLAACGAKSSGSDTAASSTTVSTPGKPAGAGAGAGKPTTTKARPPACVAADKLGYDFLVAEKGKNAPANEKTQIVGSIQKHAAELKAAAPQMAATVDALVTYQVANLNGNASANDKTKSDQADKDLETWYKSQPCG